MKLQKANGRQWPLLAEVVLDIGADSILNTAGVMTALAAGGALLSDLFPFPPNSQLIAGALVVEVASNSGTTHTVSVGDSASAARYLAATDLKTVARTALTPTGYRGTGEDIRLTFAQGGTLPTAGRFTLHFQYYVVDRANENQPN
jgi:hypothetical protein